MRRYSLLKFKTFRWFFCFTGPTLTFIYLLSEKPFGFGLFKSAEQIKLAFYFSGPVILIWAIHLFLIQPRLFKRMNILITILWLTWIHLFLVGYYYVGAEVWFFGRSVSEFDFYILPEIMTANFEAGALITALIIMIHGGYIIRRRLQRAKEAAKQRFIESVPKTA